MGRGRSVLWHHAPWRDVAFKLWVGVCVAVILGAVGGIAFKQTLGARVVEALGFLLSGWRGHLWIIALENPIGDVRCIRGRVGCSLILVINCSTGLARVPKRVNRLAESAARGGAVALALLVSSGGTVPVVRVRSVCRTVVQIAPLVFEPTSWSQLCLGLTLGWCAVTIVKVELLCELCEFRIRARVSCCHRMEIHGRGPVCGRLEGRGWCLGVGFRDGRRGLVVVMVNDAPRAVALVEGRCV